jgi:hypothetical protein
LFLTAATVTSAQDDHQHLTPMLDTSVAALGSVPAVVAADGGYHSGAMLAACHARGQVVVMPETQSAAALARPYHVQQFHYDATIDTYTCPQGKPLTFRGYKAQKQRPLVRRYRASGAGCRACPAFGECTTDARQGRSLHISQYEPFLRGHRSWMQTDEAQALVKQRKTLVEPAFGILKEHQNLRRFLLRGLANVTAEWSLLAVGFNVRTLVRAWRAGWLLPPAGPASGGVASAIDGDTPWTQLCSFRALLRTRARPAVFRIPAAVGV